MHPNRVTLVLILATLLMSGCATMTPQQCEIADWYSLGVQDARAGRSDDHLARRLEACSKAGFSIDSRAWRDGWHEGLISYCQPESGFDQGSNGRSYHGLCPADLEPGFTEGYQLGDELRQVRNAIRSSDTAIARLEKRLEDEELDERSRRNLRRDLDRLRDQVRREERQLGALEAEARLRGLSPGYWSR